MLFSLQACAVAHGGGTCGEVIEDGENIEEQLMRYLQKLPQYVRYFKASLDPEGHPDPEDVAQAAKERVMILLRSG